MSIHRGSAVGDVSLLCRELLQPGCLCLCALLTIHKPWFIQLNCSFCSLSTVQHGLCNSWKVSASCLTYTGQIGVGLTLLPAATLPWLGRSCPWSLRAAAALKALFFLLWLVCGVFMFSSEQVDPSASQQVFLLDAKSRVSPP